MAGSLILRANQRSEQPGGERGRRPTRVGRNGLEKERLRILRMELLRMRKAVLESLDILVDKRGQPLSKGVRRELQHTRDLVTFLKCTHEVVRLERGDVVQLDEYKRLQERERRRAQTRIKARKVIEDDNGPDTVLDEAQSDDEARAQSDDNVYAEPVEELDLPSPHDDREHEIAELYLSLERHLPRTRADIFRYAQGFGDAERLFQMVNIRHAKNQAIVSTASKIIGLLNALQDLFSSASGFDKEQNEIEPSTRDYFAQLLGQGLINNRYLRQFLDRAAGEERLATVQADTLDGDGRDQQVSVSASRANDDGLIGREDFFENYLMYATVPFIHRRQIFLLIETMIANTQGDEEAKTVLRDAYRRMLIGLSRRLDPRSRREAPAILHAQRLDFSGFHYAVDKEKLPSKLWKQQYQALAAASRALKRGTKNMLFDLPGGSGKTLILTLLANLLSPGGNTLIGTPHTFLARQFRREFTKETGRNDIGLVGETSGVTDQPFTVATFSALRQLIQAGIFPPDKFRLILLDEAHRTSETFRRMIVQAFPHAVIVTATASPRDTHGESLDNFGKLIYQISLPQGMRAGVVNPCRLIRSSLPKRRTRVGTEKQDPKILVTEDIQTRALEIENLYHEHCGHAQAMIFMDDNDRAERMAASLQDRKLHAEAVSGASDNNHRFHIDLAFREGHLRLLVASGLFGEGWDHPGLQYGIFGDPIQEYWKLCQRLARILRRHPGKGESVAMEVLGGYDAVIPRNQQSGISAMDRVFGLGPDFKSGSLLVEPQSGYWPSSAFKV